ncbi:MAG: cytochrome c biosis protein CcmG, thiol:disulfide interchange protein DsbE [Solirubrobacterales bacterium]|jgi:thiol-disulfide isomerase/thioredoxin|nr:cytochrome c biosis protein CcmG, thiol:disulfide interchange protein DsbE [Solirubrobacterales bacterium]
MPRRIPIPLVPLILALAALCAVGCGSSEGGEGSSPPPDYQRLLAGSPAPLAALHEQENELLAGGVDAYEERIAALRGFPIVANVWGSWCGPCRTEFPALQEVAARYGKRVAFLGVDYQDDPELAANFLAEAPVPYPSYIDDDEKIAESIDAGGGLPNTAYYDREGNLCFLKIGQYTDAEALEADVRRFALREECESG